MLRDHVNGGHRAEHRSEHRATEGAAIVGLYRRSSSPLPADRDRQYAAGENEKARASLADVVAFAEQARDYSIQSRKHQKQTEISVRTMVRKLGDLKHAVPRDDQPEVQNAIDRLERVRDDLLLAMFPKGKGGK